MPRLACRRSLCDKSYRQIRTSVDRWVSAIVITPSAREIPTLCAIHHELDGPILVDEVAEIYSALVVSGGAAKRRRLG
jgi:hypothetical protein